MDAPSKDFGEYLDWISHSWDLFEKSKRPRKPNPPMPGQEIRKLLKQKRISQSEIARQIGCTHARINEIINGKRAITPRFALELERVLKVPASYLLSLQVEFDLWLLRR